jgi:predicted PurR-regulated permease PerM
VLIASSILGVVGAILAVPFAAVIKIVMREAGAERRARMAALREPLVPESPELPSEITR